MSAKDELNYEFSFFESEDSLAKYNTKKKKKNINNEKIIAVSLFFSIIICLEFFFGYKTKYISLLLFGNNDYKRCILLNKLDLYKYDIRYAFIFILYSYINMYAVFCFMALDTVDIIIADIIRLAFYESRPFWDENSNVFPCKCEYTPSNPSPTATKSFLLFSLFLFIQNEQKYKSKLSNKNNFSDPKKFLDENESNISEIRIQVETKSNIILIFLSIFLISLILFIDAIPLLQNIEYLHQTIFGISLSFSFYYLVFYIFRVNHLVTKQFIKIIKQPWIIITFSLALIFLIFFILNNIAYSITTSQLEQIEKFCEIPNDFNLSTEILKNCSLLFETLGAYFGILIEYIYTFKSNKEKFLTYNVKSRDKKRYNENSNPIKNLVVFLLLFFIEYIFFKTIIEVWIKNYFDGINQFIAMSVELFFKGIFFFYVMKRLMSKICLLNNDIFSNDN